MATNSIAIRIAGKEYRIRSDADEAWLQRVARYVDESFREIRERTSTVDSFDIAILAALNLGQELIELREAGSAGAPGGLRIESAELAELIDFVESELSSPEVAPRLDA